MQSFAMVVRNENSIPLTWMWTCCPLFSDPRAFTERPGGIARSALVGYDL